MCRVKSPRLATVEALSQVMRVPEVEVADLRALDADNAEEVSCRHLECLGIPWRHPFVLSLAGEWLPADVKARLQTVRQDVASLNDYDAQSGQQSPAFARCDTG